jgi:type I restriction enzyme S subunit
MIHPITKKKIPDNWKLVKVDDVKSTEKYSCVAGPFGSDISSKYFVYEGIPVIRGNNLTTDYNRFISSNFAFVTKERAKKYSTP